jgi:hypothetical protein
MVKPTLSTMLLEASSHPFSFDIAHVSDNRTVCPCGPFFFSLFFSKNYKVTFFAFFFISKQISTNALLKKKSFKKKTGLAFDPIKQWPAHRPIYFFKFN